MTSSGNSLLSHPLSLRSGTHTRGRRRQRESPLSVHGRAQPRPPMSLTTRFVFFGRHKRHVSFFFLEDTKDTCFFGRHKTFFFGRHKRHVFFWNFQKKSFFLEDTKDTVSERVTRSLTVCGMCAPYVNEYYFFFGHTRTNTHGNKDTRSQHRYSFV
jgi:hypothetical protein